MPEELGVVENIEIAEQLRVYDEEVKRGIVHTRSYDIKMEQYRLSLEGKYPHA